MKKVIIVFLFCAALGCAKVSVESTKPIKVDISMRVDVYQHMVQEVDSIEDQIYGDTQKELNCLFSESLAYAADFSSPVNEAIERRKARVETIETYLKSGYIGEDKDAYLALPDEKAVPSQMRGQVKKAVEEENADRRVIYEATAKKNNTSVSQITDIFFQDHYRRAPAGYWFQVLGEKENTYIWVRK